MKNLLKVLGVAALLAAFSPAEAYVLTENTDAYVVSSCGAQAFALGSYATITQLANGELCTSGSGGGGSATNATIVAPLAVSGSVKTLDDNSAAALTALQAGATSALQTTGNTSLATIATNTAAATPAGANAIGITGNGYTSTQAPITASATGTTAATTATLAASASLKTYICWFSIRANATAAATANSTVTGTVTGTLNFTQWTAPLASGIGLTEMIFNPCIPSSAINTAIAVVSAAPGSGGVVSVSAGGFQGP